jgi:hypothetical protein
MISVLTLALLAGGFPDGAPWGHAGAPQTDTCAGCHWDNAPETQSPRLILDGVPDRFMPGQRYELMVSLADAGDVNGYQLAASSGRFEAASAASEADGGAIRSTGPAGSWPVVWIAGDAQSPVRFWLAVLDANDDASPLGDRVLLNTFESLP